MNNIKSIRENRGLTLKELAEKTGLSAGYLCHLEKETRMNPTLKTLIKIANALQVSVDELYS